MNEWSLIQTVISVAAGLGGVWFGAKLTSKREADRESERNKKEAVYLAILVVAHLDRLAYACLRVAFDDGTEEGQPAGAGGCWAPTIASPTFDPLTLDVNWKALPADLMYETLGMPYRIEELEREIRKSWDYDDPPEYSEFFWARQYGYAVLGLEVSDLARRLREHANLPAISQASNSSSRDDLLREQRNKINSEREAYYARCNARQPMISRDCMS